MDKRVVGAVALTTIFALLGFHACDVTSPERVLRAPVIRGYAPPVSDLDVLVGDTLSFSVLAIDPNDRGLEFRFVIGDSVIGWGPALDYVVADTGTVCLVARVTNGVSESTVEWRLTRRQPVNKPPVVVDFSPAEPNPTLTVGEGLRFSMTAQDPEGRPLDYIITVDDSIVTASNRYLFVAREVGQFAVRAIATDGAAFTVHDWNLRVLAEPDSVPPAIVELMSLRTGTEPGQLNVTFVGVGDDGMSGTASGYLIRTASSPIIDEITWRAASGRPGPVVPTPAGAIQSLVIRSLKPANYVWVSIRAVDDFGNLSPLGPTLGAWTKGMEVFGKVRNALTGSGVPGVAVSIAGVVDTTEVDGRFALTELPEATAAILIRDEADPSRYGAFYDVMTSPYKVQHDDDLELWMIPNVTLQSPLYPSFLQFIFELMGTKSSDNRLLRTWQWPVDVYIEPLVLNNIDYAQVMRAAFVDWENRIGADLFRFVDARPVIGVDVVYDTDISRDYYEVLDADPLLFPLRSRIHMRTIYTEALLGTFHSVARHEVGHALGMKHSADADHLMVGTVTPQVDGPSADEIALGRVVTHLPRGHRLDWHLLD